LLVEGIKIGHYLNAITINSTLLNRSVAMQPNKTKLALQIGAVLLGAATASNTYATPFDLIVNTISDVTIDTVTPMTFGTSILTDELVSCTMSGDQPAPATVRSDGTYTAGTGTNLPGALTGAGCITTNVGTPGLYTISGEAALEVNITLNTETQTGNFEFSPDSGCAADYDNATATATTSDPCTALVVGTPLPVDLPGATDAVATVAGVGYFSVGGTISTLAGGLTSDTPYTATFQVNVIY
jgi:hypothetical protein